MESSKCSIWVGSNLAQNIRLGGGGVNDTLTNTLAYNSEVLIPTVKKRFKVNPKALAHSQNSQTLSTPGLTFQL